MKGPLVLWWVMEKKIVHIKYLKAIKDMYKEVVTSVKIVGDTEKNSYNIESITEIDIESLLVYLVMNELTTKIQDGSMGCIC